MTKNIPKLIVEVSGGVVQFITADRPVSIWFVDWDNIEAGDDPGFYTVNIDPSYIEQRYGKEGLDAGE